MARARNIKPGLFKNEILGVADPLYTLLFEGLWLLADRAGRLEDRPLRIKAEIFPYRDGLNVDEMLGWLADNDFILRYSVKGKKYIQVISFEKHQSPHKNETESEIPPPEDADTTTEEIGTTSEIIGSARADSLIADSGFSDCLIPDSGLSDSDSPPVHRLRAAKKLADSPPTGETWSAYSDAYQERYKTEPVRNAKVNGQLLQFVKRLGAEEAPGVAAWYVASNNRFYVQKRHAVDCLLADAEGLRTEWATNTRVTETRAREADRLQTSGDMWSRIIDETVQETANGDR